MPVHVIEGENAPKNREGKAYRFLTREAADAVAADLEGVSVRKVPNTERLRSETVRHQSEAGAWQSDAAEFAAREQKRQERAAAKQAATEQTA